MICLRCGYCCREIWPGNRNDEGPSKPCPNLLQSQHNIAVCKIYDTRPQRCIDERMGVGDRGYCQIGLMALERGKVPAPIGKCMDCGNPHWSTDSNFCSKKCEDRTIEYLNGNLF
jgi:hypothetical protein